MHIDRQTDRQTDRQECCLGSLTLLLMQNKGMESVTMLHSIIKRLTGSENVDVVTGTTN